MFPAAGYIEMATQAALRLTGATTAVLADIDLRKALFLPDGEDRNVEVALSSQDASFTVASAATGDDGERTVHASGVVRTGQRRRAKAPLDAAAIRARTVRRLDGPDCYTALAALGYHYGPAFRAIEEVWIGAGEVLARIRPPEGVDASGHHLHPVLLDACFQALLTPQLLGDPAPQAAISFPSRWRRSVSNPSATCRYGCTQPCAPDAGHHARRDRPLRRRRCASRPDPGVPRRRVEIAVTAVAWTRIDSWLAETVWTECPSRGRRTRSRRPP
ncbi:Acyltransferase domain-containing protein (Fragment) OS=Streptomyces microflavus OX=1919 GN=G3I39_11195 PE=4 SV=1 [Streptomyces microflavus]